MHENGGEAAEKRIHPTAALDATLSKLIDRCDGGADGLSDAVSQVLVAVLGSGPAVAVLDSMISANQANSLMYHQAVAQQQRTNVLGMSVMAKCVKMLLDGGPNEIIIDDETE